MTLWSLNHAPSGEGTKTRRSGAWPERYSGDLNLPGAVDTAGVTDWKIGPEPWDVGPFRSYEVKENAGDGERLLSPWYGPEVGGHVPGPVAGMRSRPLAPTLPLDPLSCIISEGAGGMWASSASA